MSAQEWGKMRSTGNDSTKAGEADATLRLIAGLPAPEGLAERAKSRLHAASREAKHGGGKLLRWPARASAMQDWMRSAAAAAIVGVVTGGAWWIYASVAPAGGGSAVAAPVSVHRAGGFSSAGAVHTPDTLKGPVLKNPVLKNSDQGAGNKEQKNRDKGQGTSQGGDRGAHKDRDQGSKGPRDQ